MQMNKTKSSTPPIILEQNKAPQIINNTDYIYHGIGLNVLKLIGIMDHGILSEKGAAEKGLNLARNFGGYNKNTRISCVTAPRNDLNTGYSPRVAFNMYIQNGISFIIDNKINDVINNELRFKLRCKDQSKKHSFQKSIHKDESQRYIIIKEAISGIFIPKETLTKPLSKISFLSNLALNYYKPNCEFIINNLKKECQYYSQFSITKINVLLEKLENIENIVPVSEIKKRDYEENKIIQSIQTEISAYVNAAFQKKFNKNKVTLKDVLKTYVPPEMPIYAMDWERFNKKHRNKTFLKTSLSNLLTTSNKSKDNSKKSISNLVK